MPILDLILSAIKYIEQNGVYRNPNNKNFLNHFGNAEIISGAVFIILLVFGIGNYGKGRPPMGLDGLSVGRGDGG